MINKSKYILGLLLVTLLVFSSCEETDYSLGALTTPSSLELSFALEGVSSEEPYGDGSGLVYFTGSATDAITMTFDFGDGKNVEIAADGSISHVFSKTGVNTYYVTMTAVGTGGLSATKTVSVEVLSSFTDDEALQLLTGGSSKTWYWAADKAGHTGLGPNFVDGTNHTWAAWYNATPFEKTCMYDAEFVFTLTDGGLTFEQTAGPAFIPGTYAGKIGVEGDVCHGEDVVPSLYGVKNVSFGPAASIATGSDGYRGTSMSFSDGGFMCWYVGTSTYEIIEITANTLSVRVEEDETFAWYHTFTDTKPLP